MKRGTIGIVGLEPVTTAMARRLAAAGYRVLVHDRQPERRGAYAEDRPRIEIAGSLADIAAECREVILWRPNLDTLKAELFGEPDRPGLAHELESGALVIDMSPGSPAIPPRVQGALGQRAIGVVDVAVLDGGPEEALAGRLEIALGGYVDFVERAETVLSHLGAVRRTGALGSARAARTITGAYRAIVGSAEAEADMLGAAAGLAGDVRAGLMALARRRSCEGPPNDAALRAIRAAAAVELAGELGLKAPLAENVAS